MIYKFKEHKKSELLRSRLNMGGAAPSGERIDVTSLYLERGGKPWIGVMGEFHFSRCERGECCLVTSEIRDDFYREF